MVKRVWNVLSEEDLKDGERVAAGSVFGVVLERRVEATALA